MTPALSASPVTQRFGLLAQDALAAAHEIGDRGDLCFGEGRASATWTMPAHLPEFVLANFAANNIAAQPIL